MRAERDWITDLGIGVVGVAAAILTFTTLRALAETVGFRESLFGALQSAWLLPVTIDAAGVVAARVWLRGTAAQEAVDFARKLTWVCISASVLGNAGQHLMAELAIEPPWWVIVLVTAVPPAMLGASVHLGNLVRRTTPVRTADPDHPVRVDLQVVQTAVPDRADHSDHRELQAGPNQEQTVTTARNHDGTTTAVRVAEPAPDQQETTQTTVPDHLLDEAVQWAAEQTGPISQRAVRARFGIGRDRAVAVLNHIEQTGRTA